MKTEEQRAKRRVYYYRNRERILANNKRYRDKHKEKLVARKQSYYAKPENHLALSAYNRRYYLKVIKPRLEAAKKSTSIS